MAAADDDRLNLLFCSTANIVKIIVIGLVSIQRLKSYFLHYITRYTVIDFHCIVVFSIFVCIEIVKVS